jgi:hypothetical protein
MIDRVARRLVMGEQFEMLDILLDDRRHRLVGKVDAGRFGRQITMSNSRT